MTWKSIDCVCLGTLQPFFNLTVALRFAFQNCMLKVLTISLLTFLLFFGGTRGGKANSQCKNNSQFKQQNLLTF